MKGTPEHAKEPTGLHSQNGYGRSTGRRIRSRRQSYGVYVMRSERSGAILIKVVVDENDSSLSVPIFGIWCERRGRKLFVTLVTEVSLISREPNLRFERISISRGFLCKSFSSFSLLHSTRLQKRTRHGLSKTCKFWTASFV